MADLTINGDENSEPQGSAGHRLGQLIGSWWEEYFVYPLLMNIAEKLDLYLDSHYQTRACRGDKIIWTDEYDNGVNYDFVLELGGANEKKGIPVGFFEVFWRRGSRHSKDKARDDTGKLLPMRESYPTARFLGILASGDFTTPARELIANHNVDLFYVPKEKIIQAFRSHDLIIDYNDNASESEKRNIANEFEEKINRELYLSISNKLRDLIGHASVKAYVAGVYKSLSALPQEIRFIEYANSKTVKFESIDEATRFLDEPKFTYDEDMDKTYRCEILYSDGTNFERNVLNIFELRKLNDNVRMMVEHMERIASIDLI